DWSSDVCSSDLRMLRPVTVTAEVAVNSAVKKPRGLSAAKGRQSRPAPSTMSSMNPPASTMGGLALNTPPLRSFLYGLRPGHSLERRIYSPSKVGGNTCGASWACRLQSSLPRLALG